MLDVNRSTHRRGFLGSVGAMAAAVGLGSVVPASLAEAAGEDPALDAWLQKLKGKHRQVYDMPEPNQGMAFAWSRVFYLTNNETGVPDKDISVMVVLRHGALPFAMADGSWAKYRFGEVFNITDPKTNAPSVRNIFYKAGPGELPLPGMGIDELLADGVLFGACNMAIKFFSAMVAKKMDLNADQVRRDWLAAVLPGIQVVPSGVWAVNRAQERGCSYCFAG
jgi:intracellular sulfur oxidation DsrE/DsrF family protein